MQRDVDTGSFCQTHGEILVFGQHGKLRILGFEDIAALAGYDFKLIVADRQPCAQFGLYTLNGHSRRTGRRFTKLFVGRVGQCMQMGQSGRQQLEPLDGVVSFTWRIGNRAGVHSITLAVTAPTMSAPTAIS